MNKFLIRGFDIVSSFVGLIALFPLFFIIALWIKSDSKGKVFFTQVRVGKDDKDFKLYKFRSMKTNFSSGGSLTVGMRDPRVTNAGYYIRKFKLDELPQLINVLKGDMSLVGPRPEVRKYVNHYTEEQKRVVLSVRPGITDVATIEYANENKLLSEVSDPERFYISEILPAKIRLNLVFIKNPTFTHYLRIILKTVLKIIKS